MSIILEHNDVKVYINELPNGKRSISIEPTNVSVFVPVHYHKTTYPVDLIKRILKVKGPYLIDEIIREEDRTYVRKNIEDNIFMYAQQDDFKDKRLLDFGCGSGASTVILARMFPDTEIVGVELVEDLVNIAKARANHYGFSDLKFNISPNEKELPKDIGEFDIVMLSAVYEHLLPNERGPLLHRLWSVMKPGATLFINQTPNRYYPIEKHTTGLPLLNYLPDRVALMAARNFSQRVSNDQTWDHLLRKGIRGGTEREIMRLLPDNATLLRPPGIKDIVDIWYRLTPGKKRPVKRLLKLISKSVYHVSGVALLPSHLNIAIRKVEKPSINR